MSNPNQQAAVDPEGEVPITLTGTVTRIPKDEISFCMDGAKYLLHSTGPEGEETLRLRPIEDDAERVLDRAAGTDREVSVTGFMRHVECTRMDVLEAQRSREHEPAS